MITINLGSARYGGRIDIVDGEAVMTVTHAITNYNKNSEWTRNTSGVFYADAPNGIDDLYISNMFKCFLPKGSSNALADGQCRLNSTSRFINFKATSCDTVDDFKAFLGDNTIQMVYELVTPITVNLGSLSVPSLLGQNNLWHDGNGDVDSLKFIDRQLYFGR